MKTKICSINRLLVCVRMLFWYWWFAWLLPNTRRTFKFCSMFVCWFKQPFEPYGHDADDDDDDGQVTLTIHTHTHKGQFEWQLFVVVRSIVRCFVQNEKQNIHSYCQWNFVFIIIVVIIYNNYHFVIKMNEFNIDSFSGWKKKNKFSI